jgi:ABC-type nickel/cobalt efflux system permease component RcnA
MTASRALLSTTALAYRLLAPFGNRIAAMVKRIVISLSAALLAYFLSLPVLGVGVSMVYGTHWQSPRIFNWVPLATGVLCGLLAYWLYPARKNNQDAR